MKKIFLHIGLHKTGSTTLQAFLRQNSNNLGNFGYLYPKTGIPPRGKAHHNLVWLLTNDKRANISFGTWKELHEEIETKNFDNIIMTSEDFGSRDKNTVNSINSLKVELQSYEVKIVLYIRRQDRRLESQYTHHIKEGRYDGDILSFCKKYKALSNYYKLLEPWKQVFGINNLIVRPLDKVQISNISHDFLKIIEINNLNYFDEVKNRNIKPGRKILEVLILANKIYGDKPQKKRNKYLKKIVQYAQKHWSEKSSYRLLSYSDASKILEWYEQSNQAVAREYLGREDGVLFYEQLEPYENHKFDIKDLSQKELLSLIQAIESTEQIEADKEELLSLIQAISTKIMQGKKMLIPGKTEQVKASKYLSQVNGHQQQVNIDRALESYQKTIEPNPNSILHIKENSDKKTYKIVVCATFKNEAPYILEWIAYHRVIKVDHFLIYDNDSNDETPEILQSLDRAGIITYINWPSKPNLNNQLAAYKDASQKLKGISEWIAFIDADEFIVPHQHNDLKSFLCDYEDVAGIVINWKLFGSSGHISKTDGLVIERFKKCALSNSNANRSFKTIAKADLIQDLINVHYLGFSKDINSIYVYPDRTFAPQLSEIKERTRQGKKRQGKKISPYINHNIIQINHYFTKSKAEWDLKRAKGRADIKLNSPQKIRSESVFDSHDRNEDEDLKILRFLEKTKQEIKFLTELSRLEPIVTKLYSKNKIKTDDLANLSTSTEPRLKVQKQTNWGEKQLRDLLEYQDKIIFEVERLSQNNTDVLSGFAVDSPKAEIKYDVDSIAIKGWVLGKNSRAVKVKVSCGDQVLAQTPVNNARPDVAKVHTQVPGARKSGFATTVSLVGMNSNSELIIQAILQDGNCISITKIRQEN